MGHFLSAAPQLDLPLGKNINFVQLGHNYIESARCDTKTHASFMDILQMKTLYIGHTVLALPKAQDILCD
jgi:hypothetical protein